MTEEQARQIALGLLEGIDEKILEALSNGTYETEEEFVGATERVWSHLKHLFLQERGYPDPQAFLPGDTVTFSGKGDRKLVGVVNRTSDTHPDLVVVNVPGAEGGWDNVAEFWVSKSNLRHPRDEETADLGDTPSHPHTIPPWSKATGSTTPAEPRPVLIGRAHTNPSTLRMDGTSPVTVHVRATTDELRAIHRKVVEVRESD